MNSIFSHVQPSPSPTPFQIEEYDSINETYLSDYENGHMFHPNNGTQPPIQFPIAFQVIIYIIYNAVFVAALLGNILVCYVVFSSPRMRTVTNYLIANLAVGDLLMALLCVPFSYISVLLQYWPFGEVLCHLVAPAQAVCVFVSAYTLVALAADRYQAILYPLQPRLRRSQAVIVILNVWLIAILTAIPIAVYIDMITVHGNPECTEVWPNETYKLVYSLTLMILQYFFPLAVLIFTYTRIALAVWGKKAPGEAEDGRDQRLAKAKRKMIKMMLTVVLAYTVSWLPFNLIVVYSDLDSSIWHWNGMIYLFPIIQWLALSTTIHNPLIYGFMNQRFRSAFRSTISNIPVLRRLSLFHDPRRNESEFHRMNTYTFQSGGGVYGKLVRNSSQISNGRTTVVNLSPSLSNVRRFPDGSNRLSRTNNAQLKVIPQLTSHSSTQQQTEGEAVEGLLMFPTSAAESNNVTLGAASSSSQSHQQHRGNKPRKVRKHDSLLESFM